MWKLRFPMHRIGEWADRYSDPESDDVPFRIGATARARGHLTMNEFLAIARWKTPRSQKLCASNSAGFVREATEVALRAKSEQVAIGVLTLLRGVSWPTASVILHFCAKRPYPILDFRALWSLSSKATAADYDYPLWASYVECTRALASATRVSMRTLDRALWAYSKWNQPAGT